ncbi:MAG: YceD family protein [Pyrinomonadaceae bacterium]
MRIELASLEGGKGAFARVYEPGDLVLEEDRVSLLEAPAVSGGIRQKGRRVHVSGSITARVQVECDRCLKLIELPIDSRFELEYVTAEDYQAQQAFELTEEDLDLSVFDGAAIDIDELVTEELLLAVPDHVLCSESCKGMCAVCGVNRNSTECACEAQEVDPRWAGLKELVNGK